MKQHVRRRALPNSSCTRSSSNTTVMSPGTSPIHFSVPPTGTVLTTFRSSLDESERPLDGPDDRKFRFRGILKIADPKWLSDFGVKTIETDLNLRVKERGMGGRRMPQLTLEDLFGIHLTRSNNATWRKEEDARLTVLIQGERNMPAVYMHSTCHSTLARTC